MPKLYVNDLIKNRNEQMNEMILKAERDYHSQIQKLAKSLVRNKDIHIVLLAGPSGSGKTTTANMLKDKIINNGRTADVVSLDNFYKNREEYPLDENGKPDWETVYALDIELVKKCLKEINENGKTNIPIFDFPTQKRSEKVEKIDVGKDGVLIIEGLHALNPVFTDDLNSENLFKVFVSVSTGIKNDEETEIISGIEIRMFRRTTRDSIYRGFSGANTLGVWQSVLDGELKYLYPYKPLADCKINTFHSFEVFVYADYIRNEMANDIEEMKPSKFFPAYKKLLELPGISADDLPATSLIKEFVPGGIYAKIYKGEKDE